MSILKNILYGPFLTTLNGLVNSVLDLDSYMLILKVLLCLMFHSAIVIANNRLTKTADQQ